MSTSNLPEQERTVLKWGGLGGIIGSVAFVACFIVALVFVGTDTAEPAGFASIRLGRTVEDGLYLAVFVLWLMPYAAMYRVLRDDRLAPSLFGSVFGIAGSIVLAAGTLPHVMTLTVSKLYESAGTTPAQQATLSLIWQSVYSIIDSLLAVGLIISTLGVLCLGTAMFRSERFGKTSGLIGVILGAIGFVFAVALLWDVSELAIAPIFALVVFHVVAGVKSLQLSKRI